LVAGAVCHDSHVSLAVCAAYIGFGHDYVDYGNLFVKTGKEEWKKAAKFWMTIFGINFAIGVATGINPRILNWYQLVELKLVCRRYFWCSAGQRRYIGFLSGSNFYLYHVFRMEKSWEKLSFGIYMAYYAGCNYLGIVDSCCQRMDAISYRNGI
jgi:hypothetical protein